MLFTDIITDSPSIVWTTHTFAQRLWQKDDAAALKKTERWLSDQRLDFPILSEDNLVDEHDRPVKKLVLNFVLDTGRRKRHSVLMATLHTIENYTVLFANDGRSGRRWLFIDNVSPTNKDLSDAIEALVTHEAKETVLIPSGALLPVSRYLVHRAGTHELHAGDITYRLGIEAYSHGRNDIDFYIL